MVSSKLFNKAIVTSAIVGLAIVPLVVNTEQTYASYNATQASKQVDEGRLILTQTTFNDLPIYKVKLNPQYVSDTEEIHIPAMVNGIPITVVDAEAFKDSQATAIYFENSDNIMEVERESFTNTAATNSITFNNITVVERSTFQKSNFSEVNLNSSKVHTIHSSAFAESKATNIMHLPLLTKIPEAAFDESSFSDIMLNEVAITEIGPSAFRKVKISKDIHFPNITAVEASTFSWSDFTSIHLDGSKIQRIGSEAFAMSQAKNLMHLPLIREVPAGAFNNTQFEGIQLDWQSITSIGKDSFRNTKETSPISMPLLTIIPDGAFAHSVFSRIDLSYDKITSIGSDSFLNTKDTQNINLPMITKVPTAAFKWSDFSEIHLSPEKVTSISSEAFYDTQATNRLDIPNVTKISSRAFAKTKFSFINFSPSNVQSFGDTSFTLPKAKGAIDSNNILTATGMQIPHEKIVLLKGHGLSNPESLIDTGYVVKEGEPISQSQRGSVTALMKYPDGTIQNIGELTVTAKNLPPIITTTLTDIALKKDEVKTLLIETNDIDDGDVVSLSADSSDSNIVSSFIDSNGSLTLTAKSKGIITISVTATDKDGEQDARTFKVEVKGKINDSGSSELEVMPGELTLLHDNKSTPGVTVNIDSKKEIHSIVFDDEITVQDARGTSEGWELSVTASPLTDGTHSLPAGSLLITSAYVENKTGNSSSLSGVSKLTTDKGKAIDTSSTVSIGKADKGHGGGSHMFKFADGLRIVVDPTTAFLENKKSTYTTTLNWTLVSGPTQ